MKDESHSCQSTGSQSTNPQFTIVITTYNRRRPLVTCLDALLAQAGDVPHEVIVVDDGSTDGTAAYLAEHVQAGRLRHLRQPNAGWPAARNRGWRVARGDVIAFLDDDCVPAPTYLAALAAAWTRWPDATGIGGRVTAQPGANYAGRLRAAGHIAGFEALNAPYGTRVDAPGPVDFCYGGNRSLRRDVLEELGGFDESLRYFDDWDLDWRLHQADHRLWYDPAIVVAHDYRLTAWGRLRADYLYGRSAPRFARRHPDFPYDRLAAVALPPVEATQVERVAYRLVQAFCYLARQTGLRYTRWQMGQEDAREKLAESRRRREAQRGQ
jgi:GT2 family glycosyltransferase